MPRATPQPRPAGDPNVAVLLTWFLPGAGHAYLGRMGFAALAFGVVEGLYALGVWFSGGMFLEILPEEMRGRFAGVLTPEVGNLGALLYHVGQYGYGTGEPRPWPPHMDLGMILTAASGVLNAMLMSRAHLDARLPSRGPSSGGRGSGDPALLALATWLVPGLGHLLQGRRLRGVVVFGLLVGLFVLGCLLAQGSNLSRERHFYYWAGQFLLGLPAMVAEAVHGHPRLERDAPYGDAGIVLACVSGLLNVLVMLEVYSFGERRLSGEDAAPARAERAAPEAGR